MEGNKTNIKTLQQFLDIYTIQFKHGLNETVLNYFFDLEIKASTDEALATFIKRFTFFIPFKDETSSRFFNLLSKPKPAHLEKGRQQLERQDWRW